MIKKIISIVCSLILCTTVFAQDDTTIPAITLINKPVVPPLVITMPYEVSDVQEWQNLADSISSTDSNLIVLRLNGYGGADMLGNNFIQAMVDAESKGKTVNIDVLGPSYSMHAIIACYGTRIFIREGQSLMFHQGGYVDTNLFGLIERKVTTMDRASAVLQDSFFNQCVNKGLLTQSDVYYILNGGDVIISNVQGSIVKYRESDMYNSSVYKNIYDLSLNILFILVLLVLVCGAITLGGLLVRKLFK